ncbi:hypothetical protein SNE40_019930 [Patella caerulea]|uniref:Endonuclease/exonuclease/phosphatase domain-containing protein n=1 Tax=Patella caerulea TaxID=87958 RepID=A0AAN8GDM3_PATCE
MDLKVLSWNVGKGVISKLQNIDFQLFLSEYDIICLSECWLQEESKVDRPGYCVKCFPRTGDIKGGGILIGIKLEFIANCTIIEQFQDCFVCLKIGQTVRNYILIICYFPPISSIYYNKYNIDIFYSFEQLVCKYQNPDNIVIATGDFNSRTSTLNDFIKHDKLCKKSQEIIQNLIEYVPDIGDILEIRRNLDNTVNQFGRNLISCCKTTGLRIINGRVESDREGQFTFNSSKGCIYVLIEHCYFDSICNFQTGIFNEFSDHAPLSFDLQYKPHLRSEQVEENSPVVKSFKSIKWDEAKSDQIRLELSKVNTCMLGVCESHIRDQESIDQCVERFSEIVTNITSPFCVKNIKSVKARHRKHGNQPDKPWFDDLCKQKYRNYKKAMHDFKPK